MLCFQHGGNAGGRNLWPFEILMLWVIGFVPFCIGLWLGRRVRLWYKGEGAA